MKLSEAVAQLRAEQEQERVGVMAQMQREAGEKRHREQIMAERFRTWLADQGIELDPADLVRAAEVGTGKFEVKVRLNAAGEVCLNTPVQLGNLAPDATPLLSWRARYQSANGNTYYTDCGTFVGACLEVYRSTRTGPFAAENSDFADAT